MRNFQKIAQGISVMQLLLAVQQNSALWNKHTLRTQHPDSPHKEVDDIWLRFNETEQYEATGDAASIIDQHESINYTGWYALPQAHPIIFDLFRLVEGIRLGRVLITRLAPGKRIPRHADGGEHARYYERYIVVLKSSPGCQMACGQEIVQMVPGEVWWFDNEQEHEVANNSEEDRIVLLVDIRACA